MNKLSLAFLAAALVAGSAFAQSHAAGEDAAIKSKPATQSEKIGAKANRKAEGAEAVKTTPTGDASPSSLGTAKMTTKSQKKEASAKRKVEGAAAAKGPKDQSGPN